MRQSVTSDKEIFLILGWDSRKVSLNRDIQKHSKLPEYRHFVNAVKI